MILDKIPVSFILEVSVVFVVGQVLKLVGVPLDTLWYWAVYCIIAFGLTHLARTHIGVVRARKKVKRLEAEA